jgi:hypothetical protein
MGKVKPKPKVPKKSSRGVIPLIKRGLVKKPNKSVPTKPDMMISPPMSDEEVGEIPGLMSESEIDQYVGDLSAGDQAAFKTTRKLLAEHLGSHAAARAWLVTPGGGYDGSPLDAIKNGMAERVLQILKSEWSRGPSYA